MPAYNDRVGPPLANANETSYVAPTTEGLVGSRDCAVLVVEDEDILRQAVVKMLRKTGFEVFEAADGSSAIDLLRAYGDKIDVILLDITIPGASSREVVAEAVKVRPDTKVIITSAYSQDMITNEMSGPQVVNFIRKPFSIGHLVQTLRNVLSS